jgi:hypothetical protein
MVTGRPDPTAGRQGALVLAEHDDPVDDPDAQEEAGQRPPRVRAADRQQRRDRTDTAGGDADDPAVGVAAEQREAAGELERAEGDQDPPQRVEVVEDEPLVVDEDVGAAQRANAVDDVQRSDDQQQDRCE